MSKSKFNGVYPDKIIGKYGLDVTRLYILYKAAPPDDLIWDEQAIVGMQRFINRLQKQVEYYCSTKCISGDVIESSGYVKFITDCYEKQAFNLAIGHLIKLSRDIGPHPCKCQENGDAIEAMIIMLIPFAPESSQDLLNMLGNQKQIQWPKVQAIAVLNVTKSFINVNILCLT